MTATITVPFIGDYNDSSDYVNDILATFIKRFKEITNKLGIEYEQDNTKDQILSNKLLVIGLCQVISKMLKEKDAKRMKYLKKNKPRFFKNLMNILIILLKLIMILGTILNYVRYW